MIYELRAMRVKSDAIRAGAKDSIREACQQKEYLKTQVARMAQDDPRYQSMLTAMLAAAMNIAGADMANLQLFDRASAALCIEAQRGFGQPFLKYFGRIQDGQAACGTAFRRRKRVIVEDVLESPIFLGTPALEVMLEAGVRSVQSTPLVGRSGRVLGIISTHWNRPWRLCNHYLFLLDLLADSASQWVEPRIHLTSISPRPQQTTAVQQERAAGVAVG